MKRGRRVIAAFGAALLACAVAGPVRAAPDAGMALRYPTPTSTILGSAHLLVEPDTDAPISGVAVFVAAGLDREPADRSGASAMVAECILRTGVAGVPLRDAIEAAGGSLQYTVDGRSVRYYVEGRSDVLASLVGMLGKALAVPDFSRPNVSAARADLGARIAESDASALSVGIQMFRQNYYATGAGMPALGTAAALSQLGPAELEAFYRATYERAGLRASAVGRPVAALPAALRALSNGLRDGAVAPALERANAIPAEAPRIIAHRDVGGPFVVVGFAAPSPDSADFGAMLLLQALLSEGFEHSNTTTPGFIERSVGALYFYDSTPAGLAVYVNGSITDPSVALRAVLVVAHSLGSKPLDAASLRRFKAAAEGQFLADSLDLSDRAYLLGTLAAQGLGDDPVNGALAALERTTSADVERAAKRYLQRYIVAFVLPRQAPATANEGP